MSAVTTISLSGMQAAQTALSVAGHNLANQATAGFRRQGVVQTAAAQGGVQTAVTLAAEPGTALEADVVNQLQAKHAFMANLAVFKTSDQMAGTLLSIRA